MDDLIDRIRQEGERPLIEGYRRLSLVLGVYLLLLLPIYLATGAGWRSPRFTVTALCALILIATFGAFRWGNPDITQALRLAALAMGGILLQVLTNLLVLRDPRLTSDVMLWLVGAALVFRRRSWLVAMFALGVIPWLAVMRLATGAWPEFHWVIGVSSAGVVAAAAHLILVGIQSSQERLRMQDHIRQRTNEQLIEMLVETVERNRTLQGLIPICAQCKKVRDDNGYWQQVEHYLATRSEATFSHGLCPGCAREVREDFGLDKP